MTIVDRFAELLGGPRFQPHVTIAGGILAAPERVELALSAASRFAPQTLEVEAVVVGTTYFHSVVLALRPSEELLAMRRELLASLALADAPFSPHLSLYYGAPPDLARATELAGRWPRTVSFEYAGVWNTAGEVCSWRELAQLALRQR